MPSVTRVEVPNGSLLEARQQHGCYADCFATRVPIRVSLAEFVRAFYTTPLFGAERWILARVLAQPSTDEEVAALADGSRDALAVWRVSARTSNEILLTDESGQTSSWLKVECPSGGEADGTRLLFGSAIERRAVGRDGEPALSRGFRWLLGFHVVYSRALLRSTASRLLAGARASGGGPGVRRGPGAE